MRRRHLRGDVEVHGKAGTYDLAVQYFDESDGASRFRLLVGGREIGAWPAIVDLPHRDENGHTATRRVFKGVKLSAGETVRIEGSPDAGEPAPLDYVEILTRDGGH